MGRTILSSGLAIGLGLALAAACRIPSTAGLPCTKNEHCDAGQHCGMEVCRPDPRPVPMGTSTGPVDPSTTGDVDLLVVLDNSPSVYQWLIPPANSLPTLVEKYSGSAEKVCTFHLGMTTGKYLHEGNPEVAARASARCCTALRSVASGTMRFRGGANKTGGRTKFSTSFAA